MDAGAGKEMGRTDDFEVFGAVEDAGFDLCGGGGAGHVAVCICANNIRSLSKDGGSMA